jgi:hypothetical protein
MSELLARVHVADAALLRVRRSVQAVRGSRQPDRQRRSGSVGDRSAEERTDKGTVKRDGPESRWLVAGGGAVVLLVVVLVLLLTGSGGGHRRPGSPPRKAAAQVLPAGGTLTTAAGSLGKSHAAPRKEPRSARTPAQVAEASRGHSALGLIETLVNARRARLSAEVAAGRIPPSREAKMLATLRRRLTAAVDRPVAPKVRSRRPRDLAAAAAYLGIGLPQLRKELHAGSSLAQVAAATPGRSVEGLIESIVAVRQVSLAETLAAGAITPKAHARLLATLRQRVILEVERLHGSHARGGPTAPPGG